MITGKDNPDAGTIRVGDTVSMISVGQERMDELEAEQEKTKGA